MNENKPIFALMYDFDKTLSPRDMQEYGFIPGIKMEPGEFWQKCNDMMQKNNMDQILAYMYVMCQEARGKLLHRENRSSSKKTWCCLTGLRAGLAC